VRGWNQESPRPRIHTSVRAYKLGLEEVNLIPSKYLMNLQPDVAKVYAYSYILRHHHDHHIGIDPLERGQDGSAVNIPAGPDSACTWFGISY
jgi:hypothetical protein